MAILYLGVNDVDRTNCVKAAYEVGEKLGEGTYGSVNVLCKKGTGDCAYVLKRQTPRKGASAETRRMWQREMAMMRKLAPLGLAPRVFDGWECKGSFYLVMERFDGTLEDYLERLMPRRGESEAILGEKASMRDAARRAVDRLMERLDELRIFHGDAKSDNVFFSLRGAGFAPQWFMGDFGFAFQFPLSTDDIRSIEEDSLHTGFTGAPYPFVWVPQINRAQMFGVIGEPDLLGIFAHGDAHKASFRNYVSTYMDLAWSNPKFFSRVYEGMRLRALVAARSRALAVAPRSASGAASESAQTAKLRVETFMAELATTPNMAYWLGSNWLLLPRVRPLNARYGEFVRTGRPLFASFADVQRYRSAYADVVAFSNEFLGSAEACNFLNLLRNPEYTELQQHTAFAFHMYTLLRSTMYTSGPVFTRADVGGQLRSCPNTRPFIAANITATYPISNGSWLPTVADAYADETTTRVYVPPHTPCAVSASGAAYFLPQSFLVPMSGRSDGSRFIVGPRFVMGEDEVAKEFFPVLTWLWGMTRVIDAAKRLLWFPNKYRYESATSVAERNKYRALANKETQPPRPFGVPTDAELDEILKLGDVSEKEWVNTVRKNSAYFKEKFVKYLERIKAPELDDMLRLRAKFVE